MHLVQAWLARHLARLQAKLGLPDNAEPLHRAQELACIAEIVCEDVNLHLTSLALDSA